VVVDPVCGMTIDENTSQFKSKVSVVIISVQQIIF